MDVVVLALVLAVIAVAVRGQRHRDDAGADAHPRTGRPALRRRSRSAPRPAAWWRSGCSTTPTSVPRPSPRAPPAPPPARSASGAPPDSAPGVLVPGGAGAGVAAALVNVGAEPVHVLYPKNRAGLDDAGPAQPVEQPRARPGARAAAGPAFYWGAGQGAEAFTSQPGVRAARRRGRHADDRVGRQPGVARLGVLRRDRAALPDAQGRHASRSSAWAAAATSWRRSGAGARRSPASRSTTTSSPCSTRTIAASPGSPIIPASGWCTTRAAPS